MLFIRCFWTRRSLYLVLALPNILCQLIVHGLLAKSCRIFLCAQMSISTLAEVNRTSKYWTVCAYVSRLWHHRGGTDNGPIKHTDMVLIDIQVITLPFLPWTFLTCFYFAIGCSLIPLPFVVCRETTCMQRSRPTVLQSLWMWLKKERSMSFLSSWFMQKRDCLVPNDGWITKHQTTIV